MSNDVLTTEPLNGERLYRLAEVAEFLTVSTQCLLRIIHRGELKARRVGKAWRIKKSDIDDFLERGSSS